MQVVDNSAIQYKHFFLQGYRALSSGAGSDGESTEKVAALIIRQALNSAGDVFNDRDVLLTDDSYTAPPDDPLMRFESDLAATKPSLDVVVVRDLEDLPEFSPPPAKPFFGDVEITRTGSPLQTLPAVDFGWTPRTDAGRMGLMDAGSFTPDPDRPWKMPPLFDNAFFNGGRQPVPNPLTSGDRVLFRELDVALNPTGFVLEITIPPAATLTVTEDGAPLSPQPSINLAVDTVVFEMTAGEVFITWRGGFDWDDAYELAVLEIS